MSTAIVYKVVVVRRDSNRMISSFVGPHEEEIIEEGTTKLIVPEGATREYKIGEITLPIPGTPLFAVSSLEDGRVLHRVSGNVRYRSVLLKCEATGVRAGGDIYHYAPTVNDLHKILYNSRVIDDTVYCDSIKPLEAIKI